MRIAIGQLWQETNTFNPLPTTRADFETFGVVEGDALLSSMANTNELGGFIQSLRAWPEKPSLVGLVRLPAWPSGTATAETFDWLMERLLASLQRALPVDAVLLALHGALVAENEFDVEGAVLQAYRQAIGPEIPLVATLDLHANVTERMVRAADALVLYHTAPHTDVYETGVRAVGVLRRLLAKAQPVTAFQKLPLVLPVERANTQDPTSISYDVRELLQTWESDPRILTAGLATVQPWLDVPELGTAVIVVTDGDSRLAQDRCAELSRLLWNRRADYLPELVSVEEGIQCALAETEGLVVLGDGADATTSGAPGDGNHLLREMLKFDWPRPAMVTLVDPQTVAEAVRRGIGSEWTARLGGKRDQRFSVPLDATVRVANIFEAKFLLSGHLAKNMAIDMGVSVVLRIGNIHILVTSRSGPHFAPELF